MPHPGADPLHELEPRTERSDPPFPRGLETGRPRKSRPPRRLRLRLRRRGPGWALLALAAAMLIAGVLLPQGLLLASGLVTAGMATHLLTTPPTRAPNRSGMPLPAPARRPDDEPRCRRR